jgi:pyruvate,water dikinase
VTLDQAAARDPAVSGGKGAALARLVGANLPVPDGFVVTIQAFANGARELLPEIERLLAEVDPADLPAIERTCHEATERITGHHLPADIVGAVRGAFEGLGAPAVAVRSSASAEDLPDASFAGQYDSFLNVTSLDLVIERILHVWASLYSTRAVAYRRRQGIADAAVRMAVVVQRLLPAEAAGVLFTRDPVSGSEDQYVVNAALGLGEGVVGGEVAADRFGIDPRTGRVLSRDIASKEYMVALAPRGGLERVKVPAAQRSAPALSDRNLADLGGLARSVRELFGSHQDIEFAVVDGSVHLLQSRPVTGVAAAPEFAVVWERPEDASYTWLLRRIAERAVLPARRLEEDALRAYFEGSGICFEETGSPMARNHIACFVNGFCYARSPEIDEAEVSERLRRYGKRAEAYAERGSSLWEEELRPQVEEALRELGGFRPQRAALPELIRHLERTVGAYAHVLGDLHWRLAGSVGMGVEWPAAYHEITGEPESDAGVFLQAIDNKTTRMIRWLRDLARLVQADSELQRIFAAGAYEQLDEPGVRTRPTVRRFRARFRNFLRRHGRRTGRGFGSATDFATPTWSMAPEQPLDLIAAYAGQDIGAMDRMETEARREREDATKRVRRQLAGDRERLARFELGRSKAVNQVRTMENHNHMMEQATGGALREAIYWLGRHLAGVGLLDDPDDVLHLSLSELRTIASGNGPTDLRALVRERTAEHEQRSRLQPPKSLGSGGPPPLDLERRFDPPKDAGRDGLLIRGVAGSRGRVTGPARVVPPTASPPQIEKGDILVAQNAGPNWTPIFPLLGGLVLDAGMVFQHAALVAREYRIPAVIMTRDATSAIRDGQTITVDGDQGIVELTP